MHHSNRPTNGRLVTVAYRLKLRPPCWTMLISYQAKVTFCFNVLVFPSCIDTSFPFPLFSSDFDDVSSMKVRSLVESRCARHLWRTASTSCDRFLSFVILPAKWSLAAVLWWTGWLWDWEISKQVQSDATWVVSAGSSNAHRAFRAVADWASEKMISAEECLPSAYDQNDIQVCKALCLPTTATGTGRPLQLTKKKAVAALHSWCWQREVHVSCAEARIAGVAQPLAHPVQAKPLQPLQMQAQASCSYLEIFSHGLWTPFLKGWPCPPAHAPGTQSDSEDATAGRRRCSSFCGNALKIKTCRKTWWDVRQSQNSDELRHDACNRTLISEKSWSLRKQSSEPSDGGRYITHLSMSAGR